MARVTDPSTVTHATTQTGLAIAVLATAGLARAVPPVALDVARPGTHDLRLSVGARLDRATTHSALFGFATLDVPLERLFAPKRIASAAPPDDGEPVAPGADIASPPGVAPSGTGKVAPPSDAETRTSRLLPPRLLARLVGDAVRVAQRTARTPERESDLDGMGSRARARAVLPDLRLRAARLHDETLRMAPSVDDPTHFSLAGGDALTLEATATFHLGQIVFTDEELAIERLRLERERAAERLTARVLARVLAWYEATSRLLEGDDGGDPMAVERERVAALVELDLLTRGWFGARVRALRLGPRTGSPRAAAAPAQVSAPEAPLDAVRVSATSTSPCSPKHATDSPTSCGALTR